MISQLHKLNNIGTSGFVLKTKYDADKLDLERKSVMQTKRLLILVDVLTLIWVGEGDNFPSLCWFSFNNSKKVKAVILVFYSIQLHFLRDTYTKFGNPYLSQSSDIGQNSDKGFLISGFLVSPFFIYLFIFFIIVIYI